MVRRLQARFALDSLRAMEQAALWTAGAVVLAGLLLRPTIGWPLLLGLLALACACAALLGPVWTIEPGMLTINLMLLGLAGALLPVILRQVRRRDRTTPVRHRAVPA